MALNDHLYNRIQPQISRIDGRIDTISNRVGTLETITNITHVTEIVNNVISADLSTKADVDHKHVTSDITDFQASLDDKADVKHKHVVSDITDFQASLDDKANISDIEKLDKKLDSKSNIDHSHSIDDVNGLKNKLEKKAEISVVANLSEIVSRKANSNHIHSISDVEGLSTKIKSLEDGISGKADSVHTHSISEISELQSTLSSKSDKSCVDSELEKKYTIDYISTIAQPDILEVTVENTGENTDAETLYFTITIIFTDENYVPQFPTESSELCNFNINYTKSETTYTINPVINIQKIDETNNITATLVNITDFDIQSGKLIINFTYSEDSTTLTFTNISNISYQSSALLSYTYNAKNIDCDLIKNTDILSKTQNQTASKNETTFTGNITADTFNGYNLGMNHRFYDIPSIPVIGTDLGMEVGRFIDFHKDANTSTDNAARIFFNHTAFHISNSTILDTGDIKARNCISANGNLENIISRTKTIESNITQINSDLNGKLSVNYISPEFTVDVSISSTEKLTVTNVFNFTITFSDQSFKSLLPSDATELCRIEYKDSDRTENDFLIIYISNTDNNISLTGSINESSSQTDVSDLNIQGNQITFTYTIGSPNMPLTYVSTTTNSSAFSSYPNIDNMFVANNITADNNNRIELLENELPNKANTVHTHSLSDITDYTAPDLSVYLTKSSAANTYETIENVTSKLENKLSLTTHHSAEIESTSWSALEDTSPCGEYTINFVDKEYNPTIQDSSGTILSVTLSTTKDSTESTDTIRFQFKYAGEKYYYSTDTDKFETNFMINESSPGKIVYLINIIIPTGTTMNNFSISHNPDIYTSYDYSDANLKTNNIPQDLQKQLDNKLPGFQCKISVDDISDKIEITPSFDSESTIMSLDTTIKLIFPEYYYPFLYRDNLPFYTFSITQSSKKYIVYLWFDKTDNGILISYNRENLKIKPSSYSIERGAITVNFIWTITGMTSYDESMISNREIVPVHFDGLTYCIVDHDILAGNVPLDNLSRLESLKSKNTEQDARLDNLESNALPTKALFDRIYPTGSIYISFTKQPPPIGQWELLEEGRFLRSVTTTSGGTGGATTHTHTTADHTLSVAEIPAHDHNQRSYLHIVQNDSLKTSVGWDPYEYGIWTGNDYNNKYPAATTNTGGGQAHNHGDTGESSNMPPYINVFIYKRIDDTSDTIEIPDVVTTVNDTIDLTGYVKYETLANYANKDHTHNLSDISDLTDTLENKLTAPLSSTPSVKSCKAIYNSADSSAYKLHFDITYTFTDSSYIACFNTSVSDKSIFTLSFNYTQSSSSSTYTTTLYIRSTTNDAYEIYTNETDNITIAYTINPGTLKFNLIFSISSDTSITYNNISAFTYNDTIFTTYRKYNGILLADNISPNINERINNKADKSHQHFTKDIVGLPEVLSAVSWTGHTHTISEVDELNTKLDEMKLEIISAIYPVGSVYYSVNNTSPATLFGIGTWQHLPSSKYTRIADSSSDVSSISTGGSDNITVNNLPAHYHTTTTYDCIGSGDINSDGIFQIEQDMNQCIKEDVATVMGGTLSGDGATCKTIVHSGTEQGAYEIGVTFREKAPTSVTWISQPQGIPNSSVCYGRYQIPTGLAGNSDAFYPSYVELHAWVRTA